jgi:hypothetical protein
MRGSGIQRFALDGRRGGFDVIYIIIVEFPLAG